MIILLFKIDLSVFTDILFIEKLIRNTDSISGRSIAAESQAATEILTRIQYFYMIFKLSNSLNLPRSICKRQKKKTRVQETT